MVCLAEVLVVARAGTREVLFVVPPLGGLTSCRLKAGLRTRRRLPLHELGASLEQKGPLLFETAALTAPAEAARTTSALRGALHRPGERSGDGPVPPGDPGAPRGPAPGCNARSPDPLPCSERIANPPALPCTPCAGSGGCR